MSHLAQLLLKLVRCILPWKVSYYSSQYRHSTHTITNMLSKLRHACFCHFGDLLRYSSEYHVLFLMRTWIPYLFRGPQKHYCGMPNRYGVVAARLRMELPHGGCPACRTQHIRWIPYRHRSTPTFDQFSAEVGAFVAS